MTQAQLEFKRGYFLAVANIMRLHDAGVIACDVLGSYGPVDLEGIDEHDKVILRPLVAELRRQSKITDGAVDGAQFYE